jgi:hypothetical protein
VSENWREVLEPVKHRTHHEPYRMESDIERKTAGRRLQGPCQKGGCCPLASEPIGAPLGSRREDDGSVVMASPKKEFHASIAEGSGKCERGVMAHSSEFIFASKGTLVCRSAYGTAAGAEGALPIAPRLAAGGHIDAT